MPSSFPSQVFRGFPDFPLCTKNFGSVSDVMLSLYCDHASGFLHLVWIARSPARMLWLLWVYRFKDLIPVFNSYQIAKWWFQHFTRSAEGRPQEQWKVRVEHSKSAPKSLGHRSQLIHYGYPVSSRLWKERSHLICQVTVKVSNKGFPAPRFFDGEFEAH